MELPIHAVADAPLDTAAIVRHCDEQVDESRREELRIVAAGWLEPSFEGESVVGKWDAVVHVDELLLRARAGEPRRCEAARRRPRWVGGLDGVRRAERAVKRVRSDVAHNLARSFVEKPQSKRVAQHPEVAVRRREARGRRPAPRAVRLTTSRRGSREGV